MHKSGYSFSCSKCKRQPMLPIKIVYFSSKCLHGKQKHHCQASCLACLESALLQGKSKVLSKYCSVLVQRGRLAWAVRAPWGPASPVPGDPGGPRPSAAGAAACWDAEAQEPSSSQTSVKGHILFVLPLLSLNKHNTVCLQAFLRTVCCHLPCRNEHFPFYPS